MLFRLRSPLAFFASLAVASFTVAQTPPPPVSPSPASLPPLTLEECVARALDKNFDLKIQHFSTDTAKDALEIAKGTFDPTLQLSTTRSYTQSPPNQSSFTDPNGNIIVTRTQTKSETTDTRLGVTEVVSETGGTISASTSLDRSKSDPARSNPNPAYNGDFSLSVRQPILRGAGRTVTRAAIERAKIGITRANYDFKSSVLTVVRNVESAYYALAFAREQAGVRSFSLELAQRLLDENRAKRNSGVATDLDVLQAEVGLATARRNVLLADQEVRNREDDLLSLINPFQFDTRIGPVTLTNDPVPNVSFDISYKLAIDNTPEYASSRALIEQLKIDANVAKKNRLPQFDVSAATGLSSRENGYSRASSRLWNGDGYDWQVDATLSLPWGLRADRARYRQALSSLDRENVHLQQIDQNIVVEVRSAVRSVETNRESVRISALATELSQKQFDLEKARYDAGVSTFRRVQEAQEQLDTAQVNELQAKVTLRNALADLSRLEGSSLQRYRIKLEQ